MSTTAATVAAGPPSVVCTARSGMADGGGDNTDDDVLCRRFTASMHVQPPLRASFPARGGLPGLVYTCLCGKRYRRSTEACRPEVRTPMSGWFTAVAEAGHGFGIPVCVFGDTGDKAVLHAGHLGYAYEYEWGAGIWWRQRSGWAAGSAGEAGGTGCYSRETAWRVHDDLLSVAAWLTHAHGMTVDVCLPYGTHDGFLYTHLRPFLWCTDKENAVAFRHLREQCEDLVLFVYDLSPARVDAILAAGSSSEETSSAPPNRETDSAAAVARWWGGRD